MTAILHLALLYTFVQSRQQRPPAPFEEDRPAIQWLRFLPRAPMPSPLALPQKPPPLRLAQTRRDVRPSPQAARLETAPAAQAPEETLPPATPPAEAPPAPAAISADELRRIIRRDIGKIDKDLQKEHPERGIKAPLDTPQARLERGFDAAHAAVPPKWYQAARTEELSRPGTTGDRTYKITTALGSYCITVASTGEKKYRNCPN